LNLQHWITAIFTFLISIPPLLRSKIDGTYTKKNTECSLERKAASTSSSFCAYKFCTANMIPAPSVEKQQKTWFTYFGAVNIELTPFGKTAING